MVSVHPFKRLYIRLSVVCLLSWLLFTGDTTHAQSKPEPKEPSDKTPEIQTLLKERHGILEKVLDLMTVQYRVGGADFAQVVAAERDVLTATLQLEESPQKRLAALQHYQKTAKTILEVAEARFNNMVGVETDVLRAKAQLLQVQIELLREELKTKSRN
jgi:outer membrane protein TolC